MTGLKPFFRFHGSKYQIAECYPAPMYSLIIEPFAGSAGYSLYYPHHDVVLNDADEMVYRVWEYLTRVRPEEIRALPNRIGNGVTVVQRELMGFWQGISNVRPRKQKTTWILNNPRLGWGDMPKERIASQVPFIRHWRVKHGDYRDLPDIECTWFIDPPYERYGYKYRYGSRLLDYRELAEWCLSRRGQIIVCEGKGARWLDFQPLEEGVRYMGRKQIPDEQIWYRVCPTSADDPRAHHPANTYWFFGGLKYKASSYSAALADDRVSLHASIGSDNPRSDPYGLSHP